MRTTKTRERPILFSGPMVRRILDGAKTQTRRVLKPQPTLPQHNRLEHHEGCVGAIFSRNGVHGGETVEQFDCPYGGPGDRLWVRETWAETEDEWGCPIIAWKAGGSRVVGADGERCDGTWRQFIIDDSRPGAYEVETWRPSIFMPRWASRITLEITDVRVERLQDISADDLTAEGYPPDNGPMRDGTRLTFAGRKMVFAESWDKLNEHRGYGWETNPYVWAITFKRLTPDPGGVSE